MMTDELSADEWADKDSTSDDGNRAGHVAIGELLDAQSRVPPRSIVYRLFGMSPLSPETQLLYQAVMGEIEVGRALDRLGAGWVVIHALASGTPSSDFDHLVIGPGGVFIVSTKNHTGVDVWTSERALIAAGVRYPHIRDLEFDMGRAERLLSNAIGHSVEVSGILAVGAPRSIDVVEKHRDVEVLSSSQLIQWLARRSDVLSPSEVLAIAKVAELPSTWEHEAEPTEKAESERIAFEELRSRVRSAWRIQLVWVLAISATIVGGFMYITYSILMNALMAFGK